MPVLRTSTVSYVEVKGLLNQRIRNNKKYSLHDIAPEISVSHGKKQWENGLVSR
jgi:hypothetical protein